MIAIDYLGSRRQKQTEEKRMKNIVWLTLAVSAWEEQCPYMEVEKV